MTDQPLRRLLVLLCVLAAMPAWTATLDEISAKIKAGNYEEAESDLEPLVTGDKVDQKALRLALELYTVQGRYFSAADPVNRLLDGSGKDDKALLLQGADIARLTGDFPKAEARYKKYVAETAKNDAQRKVALKSLIETQALLLNNPAKAYDPMLTYLADYGMSPEIARDSVVVLNGLAGVGSSERFYDLLGRILDKTPQDERIAYGGLYYRAADRSPVEYDDEFYQNVATFSLRHKLYSLDIAKNIVGKLTVESGMNNPTAKTLEARLEAGRNYGVAVMDNFPAERWPEGLLSWVVIGYQKSSNPAVRNQAAAVFNKYQKKAWDTGDAQVRKSLLSSMVQNPAPAPDPAILAQLTGYVSELGVYETAADLAALHQQRRRLEDGQLKDSAAFIKVLETALKEAPSAAVLTMYFEANEKASPKAALAMAEPLSQPIDRIAQYAVAVEWAPQLGKSAEVPDLVKAAASFSPFDFVTGNIYKTAFADNADVPAAAKVKVLSELYAAYPQSGDVQAVLNEASRWLAANEKKAEADKLTALMSTPGAGDEKSPWAQYPAFQAMAKAKNPGEYGQALLKFIEAQKPPRYAVGKDATPAYVMSYLLANRLLEQHKWSHDQRIDALKPVADSIYPSTLVSDLNARNRFEEGAMVGGKFVQAEVIDAKRPILPAEIAKLHADIIREVYVAIDRKNLWPVANNILSKLAFSENLPADYRVSSIHHVVHRLWHRGRREAEIDEFLGNALKQDDKLFAGNASGVLQIADTYRGTIHHRHQPDTQIVERLAALAKAAGASADAIAADRYSFAAGAQGNFRNHWISEQTKADLSKLSLDARRTHLLRMYNVAAHEGWNGRYEDAKRNKIAIKQWIPVELEFIATNYDNSETFEKAWQAPWVHAREYYRQFGGKTPSAQEEWNPMISDWALKMTAYLPVLQDPHLELVNIAITNEATDKDVAAITALLQPAARSLRDGNADRDIRMVVSALRENGLDELAASYLMLTTRANSELPTDPRKTAEILLADLSSAMRGLHSINVPRTAPEYDLHLASRHYVMGERDRAMELFGPKWTLLKDHWAGLNPDFVLAALNWMRGQGMYSQVETLIRTMRLSDDSMPVEMKAGIQLVSAHVANDKKNYDLAMLGYNSIIRDPQLSQTKAGMEAQFSLVEVLIEVRNFESATVVLDRLIESPDREIAGRAYYLMALMAYEQEDYDTAEEHIKKVRQYRVYGNEAGLLQAQINLQKRKLIEVVEIRIGDESAREFLTPGKRWRVTVNDQNLSVAANGQAIDVQVTTSNGDSEIVKLFQSEGSTTEFAGEIMPVLGEAKPNNHQLEILGGAEITYNYTDELMKQRATTFEAKKLRVASDAVMKASSGEFLTEEQKKQQQLEREYATRMGEVNKQEMGRNEKTIRPGNPLHVQIKDSDQAISKGADTVYVKVTTSSGDVIEKFPVKETGPFTGVFESKIPTGIPLPRASASDSLEGSEPGWMINSSVDKTWESAQDSVKPKWVEVDIQQPTRLARMEIEMGDDRQVTDVELLASRVNMDFRRVASLRAWDRKVGGKPIAGIDIQGILPEGNVPASSRTPDGIRSALIEGQPLRAVLPSNTQFRRETLDKFRTGAERMHLRMFGYFWLDEPRQLTMRGIVNGGRDGRAYIYIDGELKNIDKNKDASFTMQLGKGLHNLEVLAYLESLQAEFRPEYLTEEGEWQLLPADWFSAEAHPELVKAWEPAATMDRSGNKLIVAFTDDTRYRQLRLIFNEFVGDSIKIKQIMVADRDGKQIVPAKNDFSSATSNQTLEIAAGDEIVVTYLDEIRLNKEEKNKPLTETLGASFYNASISIDLEIMDEKLHREARFFPAKRVKVGDNLMIRVEDWDMDTSDEQDVINVVIEGPGAKPVTVKARESEKHSGVFHATIKFRDSAGDANTVALSPGSTVTVKYFDEQNTNPGVGVDRIYKVFEAGKQKPDVSVLETETKMVNILDTQKNKRGQQQKDDGRKILTKQIIAHWPTGGEGSRTSIDAPLLFAVESPSDAFNELSVLEATVISKSEKEAGMKPYPIKLRLVPMQDLAKRKGYDKVVFVQVPQADRLERGMFTGVVRLQLGKAGDDRFDDVYAAEAAFGDSGRIKGDEEEQNKVPTVVVQGNDEVILEIKSNAGTFSQTVGLYCDGQLNFMDRTFEEEREGFYLGESLNLQVIDFDLDRTAEPDKVAVKLVASGGDELSLELSETLPHSGIFTGTIKPVYRKADEAAPINKEDGTLSIGFGETLSASFMDQNHRAGTDPIERSASLEVFLGSDGVVNTFSKQFKDEDIAVKTAFTVAEAYFELAKEHRKLEKVELADEEIAIGKRLLTEALKAYPNTKYAAQAEYLLANLAQELAETTGEYDDAIAGYTTILQAWPDSEYAPKAQYKLALCYEKLERWDQAVEEYVKITYKYPNDPLVASVIIRLGQYFWKTENYLVAGDVFKSFQKRFPEHNLAAKAMLLSGQSYIKAKDYGRAIEILKELVDTYVDERDVRAEAMYWLGDSQRNSKDLKEAYKTLKKLTWDYPETKWAKMARALLLGEEFSRIADQLERG